MEIFNKVKEILVEELGVDESKVEMNASIIKDLEADSLAVMQVVMAIEAEFDVEINEDEIVKFDTVEDVVKYLEAK